MQVIMGSAIALLSLFYQWTLEKKQQALTLKTLGLLDPSALPELSVQLSIYVWQVSARC